MDCSMPGFPVLYYLSEFAQTHVHWVGDAIQPFHPLLPPSPLALNLSQHQGLFLWVSSWHQVTKVLELSFSISPFNEYSGLIFFFLIFFRIDSFDLLSGQGTLKSLLQHHSSKAYILQRFLYGPTLTSLHNYWKKHIFIYMDLCQQSGVCFLMKGNLTKIDLGGQKGELSYMYPLKSIRSHWMSRRKTDFLFAWP